MKELTMNKAHVPVDFNEMIDHNIVMLSQTDTRTDFQGNLIVLYEGMPISVYEEDVYADGEVDYLIAEGTVIKHDLNTYPCFPHVKWLCYINADGIQNKPELRIFEKK